MNETQMPTIENPDAKYRANGGAVTHTKKSLQEKQEERKALHQRKINSKIAKSMKKHHLQERRRASADRARHAPRVARRDAERSRAGGLRARVHRSAGEERPDGEATARSESMSAVHRNNDESTFDERRPAGGN